MSVFPHHQQRITPSDPLLPSSATPSDRPSVRVDSQTHLTPVNPDRPAPTAPEGMALPQGRHPSSERGSRQAERHYSQLQVEALSERLTGRDQAILSSLQLHRFLTTAQLQRFHFLDHDTPAAAARACRRTLQRLEGLQVVQHLVRRIGGVRAGSASYVWQLGLLGDRLLRLHDDGRPRARRKEPGLRSLRHRLGVADTHLALLPERPGDPELLLVETEPDSWRHYRAPSGERSVLKPDLYAVTAAGDYEDHWWFEIDLGTESLPTQLDKCRVYTNLQRSGQADQLLGLMPRVVWVMSAEHHADRLAAAIARARDLPAELFRICSLPGLRGIIRGGAA